MIESHPSTATQLIYASRWNNDAEACLQRVYEHSAGLGMEGSAIAYPTTLFETTRVALKRLGSGQAVC